MGLTRKQKQVFDFIISYQEGNGYAPTQKEILEHFKLKSFGSVQRYLKYLKQEGLLESDWNARRGLKVNLDSTNSHRVLSLKSKNANSAEINSNSQDDLQIPLLGKVAAGLPIEAIEQADEFIQAPKHMLKGAGPFFALEVQGDSMINAGILEGDLIVCRQENTAKTGQIVVAIIDGEATVKTFRPSPSKGFIELVAENPNYAPIIVNNSHDMSLAGVLVGLIRKYE